MAEFKEMQFKDEDRIRTMLALYHETNSEITRYRDYEWKLPIWTAALLVFVAGAANQIDLTNFDCGKKYILKTILGCFSVVATAFASWYIYSLHNRLTESRKTRRVISNLFEFSKKDVYIKGESLLPGKFNSEKPKFSDGITHVMASWLFVVLVLAYTLVFIFLK